MFFKRVKNCIATVVALSCFFLACLFVWEIGGTRFPSLQGERQFYLDFASSQATVRSCVRPWEIARVRGERVCVELAGEEAEGLIRSLCGEILFIEEVEGVRAYYCYTPTIVGGIVLGEYFVNLHVVAGERQCVVGSPIIFGDF